MSYVNNFSIFDLFNYYTINKLWTKFVFHN